MMSATAFERKYLCSRPRKERDLFWAYIAIGVLFVGCIFGTIINGALPGSYEKAHAAEIAASFPKNNKEACILARKGNLEVRGVGVAEFVKFCRKLGVSI